MASLLVDLGVVCGAIIAVLTAITLVSKLPPVRWLWTNLISGPLGRWTKGLVHDGAAEFHEQFVAPQIGAIGGKVDELLEQSATSWHADKAWIVSRLTRIEERHSQLVQSVVAVLERSSLPEDPTGVVAQVIETLNGMHAEGADDEG